eukprot:161253-Rhodomonas_salina.2
MSLCSNLTSGAGTDTADHLGGEQKKHNISARASQIWSYLPDGSSMKEGDAAGQEGCRGCRCILDSQSIFAAPAACLKPVSNTNSTNVEARSWTLMPPPPSQDRGQAFE